MLIAAAGGAAWHFGLREEDATALGLRARTAAATAEAVSLEKAADYWLAQAGSEKAGSDFKGSGTALAVAIRLGQAEAARERLRPVPERLKKRFRRHYAEAVLENARWTVAAPGSRLGRALARWPVKEGAVTLGDTIVFKTERASRNEELFAHELAHVEQYRALGISEFAQRYSADPAPIEEEATAKSKRVMRES